MCARPMKAVAAIRTFFSALPSYGNVVLAISSSFRTKTASRRPVFQPPDSVLFFYFPTMASLQASSSFFTSAPSQIFLLALPMASQYEPICGMDGMGNA